MKVYQLEMRVKIIKVIIQTPLKMKVYQLEMRVKIIKVIIQTPLKNKQKECIEINTEKQKWLRN